MSVDVRRLTPYRESSSSSFGISAACCIGREVSGACSYEGLTLHVGFIDISVAFVGGDILWESVRLYARVCGRERNREVYDVAICRGV